MGFSKGCKLQRHTNNYYVVNFNFHLAITTEPCLSRLSQLVLSRSAVATFFPPFIKQQQRKRVTHSWLHMTILERKWLTTNNLLSGQIFVATVNKHSNMFSDINTGKCEHLVSYRFIHKVWPSYWLLLFVYYNLIRNGALLIDSRALCYLEYRSDQGVKVN